MRGLRDSFDRLRNSPSFFSIDCSELKKRSEEKDFILVDVKKMIQSILIIATEINGNKFSNFF
jgi:hypothetical protein